MNLVCQTCGCECLRTGQRQKVCKVCAGIAAKARQKAWREANREKIRAKIDPEKNRAKVREWAKKNPERAKAQAAKTYANNKALAIARAAKWAAENPDRRREISTESARKARSVNPEQFRAAKIRRRSVPANRLHESISTYIRICLRKNKSGATWESLVGYTLNDLVAHLTGLFENGMSMENYGEWHIDHIRPIASFTISSSEDDDFRKCWALSNLQPLWASDNMRKGSKWNGVRVVRRRPKEPADATL